MNFFIRHPLRAFLLGLLSLGLGILLIQCDLWYPQAYSKTALFLTLVSCFLAVLLMVAGVSTVILSIPFLLNRFYQRFGSLPLMMVVLIMVLLLTALTGWVVFHPPAHGRNRTGGLVGITVVVWIGFFHLCRKPTGGARPPSLRHPPNRRSRPRPSPPPPPPPPPPKGNAP